MSKTVVTVAAVVLLAACAHQPDRHPDIKISTPSPIIRVEYANPAGPVEVAALPVDQLTQICVARPGVVEVRGTDNRIGYATATDLPTAKGLGVCDQIRS